MKYKAISHTRSPLHDATHRAAVLPGMTAAALRQLLKLYFCYLFYNIEAFIEVPRLCSLIKTRIPRRNPFAPIGQICGANLQLCIGFA